MDFATLFAASRLSGIFAGRFRVVLAAVAGGIYAVLGVFFPPLQLFPLHILAGILLCVIAFGRKIPFVRVCILYFLVSAAFAGIAFALGTVSGKTLLMGTTYYFIVPFRALVLTAVVSYVVSGVLLRGDAAHGVIKREVETLKIEMGQHKIQVQVLKDTGNDLIEPVTGRPAIIINKAAAKRLFQEKNFLTGLTTENAAEQFVHLPNYLSCRFGLLPYQTVGTEGGMFLYFRPDAVRHADDTLCDCVLAISPDGIKQSGYEGLIGV